MTTLKRFPRKLTGAQARLFAAGCLQYSDDAQHACNDTPANHPIFSWLSPQQRLSLVKDVMIGLLCENEPLPPETIQHFSAHLGVLAAIDNQVEVEIAFVDAGDWEVGQDLIDDVEEMIQIWPDHQSLTSEEIDERNRSFDLVKHQAEKNKKKFDRQDSSSLGEYKASLVDLDESKEGSLLDKMSVLFSGPPATAASRHLRRPLTSDEKDAFRWRRLCDEAFQEDPRLHNVSFNWKSCDRYKWFYGVNYLFYAGYGANLSKEEHQLQHGEIGEREYADKASWPRIREIERIVKGLRESYDPFWKPEHAAVDQRYIYALCATELVHN